MFSFHVELPSVQLQKKTFLEFFIIVVTIG